MLTNHESKIFIDVYIMDFMDLKLLFMTHKQKQNKTHTHTHTHTHTQITKKRNILVIVWMGALIKHSTTNKTNSNNN